MIADLRSHAIAQRAREMSDDVDPACRSVLEAMESAAKPTDREWARLRQVEAAAKRLEALSWVTGNADFDQAMDDLLDAIYPPGEGK